MEIKIPSVISYQRTGSNYTCNPPVLDTDIDYIVLVSDFGKAASFLLESGFVACTELEYYGNMFYAFRKGQLNLIITWQGVFYERFCAATMLAKHRNLLDKDDRVDLFKVILYGEYLVTPTKSDFNLEF